MDLHDQLGFQVRSIEPGLDGDHRELDEVRGRALHRRVDRGALGGLAAHGCAAAELGEPQAAAEYGLDVAGLARALPGFVHEALGARIAREIAVDVDLRGAALDRSEEHTSEL